MADAPRQVINAITLYSFGKSENFTTDLSVYFSGSILKDGVIVTMVFTTVMWIGSALLLLIAAFMYVPLLCYIQGNLKEYCCHKVDKRLVSIHLPLYKNEGADSASSLLNSRLFDAYSTNSPSFTLIFNLAFSLTLLPTPSTIASSPLSTATSPFLLLSLNFPHHSLALNIHSSRPHLPNLPLRKPSPVNLSPPCPSPLHLLHSLRSHSLL